MFFDSVVLITGAASGIGLGTAKMFIEQNATVIGCDIDEEALDRCQDELGKNFIGKKCDMGSADDIERLYQEFSASFGKLDIIVNNAGATPWVGIEDIAESEIDTCMSVNIKGPILLVKHFAKLLRKSSNPSVVNIASIAAIIDGPDDIIYGITKAGIDKYTRALTRNLPGIRTNTILPGLIQTPVIEKTRGKQGAVDFSNAVKEMCPCGRIGTVEDIANCVLFLSSDKATYINGASITVDGGVSRSMGWFGS